MSNLHFRCIASCSRRPQVRRTSKSSGSYSDTEFSGDISLLITTPLLNHYAPVRQSADVIVVNAPVQKVWACVCKNAFVNTLKPSTSNATDLVFFGTGGETVLFHTIDQCTAAYVEETCGVRLIAIELLEGAADKLAFDSFEANTFLR